MVEERQTEPQILDGENGSLLLAKLIWNMATIRQKRPANVVFLGGGRITSALCAGLRLAGDQREIVVYDRHPGKLRALRQQSGVEIARDLKSAVGNAEMLVVAVRP